MNQIREIMNESQLNNELISHPNDVILLLSSGGRIFTKPFICEFSPKRKEAERKFMDAYRQHAQASLGMRYCIGFEDSYPLCLECPGFAKAMSEGFPDGMKVKLEDIFSKDLVHNRAPLSLGDD
jgi:hypothetical protein